jgi:hypothetical protein
MEPEELYKNILRRFAKGGKHIEMAEDCIELIEKAKDKWEHSAINRYLRDN